jgi:hypothetical protein
MQTLQLHEVYVLKMNEYDKENEVKINLVADLYSLVLFNIESNIVFNEFMKKNETGDNLNKFDTES